MTWLCKRGKAVVPYDYSDDKLPVVPEHVEFTFGNYVNQQELRLATYRFSPRLEGKQHRGTVFLCHGYAVHALDHQLFGRSEGARGLRCYFDNFDDLASE